MTDSPAASPAVVVVTLAVFFASALGASTAAANPAAGGHGNHGVLTGTPVVTNVTDAPENTTDDGTGNTRDSVTNTTDSATNTTDDTVENATDAVTNETDALANETEVVTNETVAVASTLESETSLTDGESLTATASGASGERTRTAGAAGAPAANGGSGAGGSLPELPAGSAAVGGALLVGVTAAAASRQFASAGALQLEAIAGVGRSARASARVAAGRLRSRVARLPRVVLPLGYSRYDDSDPLDHDVRVSLFEVVERSPGINLSELDARTDVSLSSVRHHLRILEEENLLVSERIRGERRYFLSTESEPELVAALDDTTTAPILRALAASGPASVSELVEELGRDPSTISHHVSRLEDDGLVEREREGQSVQNSLVPVAERVLTRRPGGQHRPVATE